MSLLEFLTVNEKAILVGVHDRSPVLASAELGSEQVQQGLPIFFKHLLGSLEQVSNSPPTSNPDKVDARVGVASTTFRPFDAAVTKSAGVYGKELQRLGFTLSNVVHAYGAVCQEITAYATEMDTAITSQEFQELNRSLDTAIAGAVSAFLAGRVERENTRETAHLGFLAHELRNGLSVIRTALHLIKAGTVGFGGSTGQMLDRALTRQQELIDRSLAEVRLQVDPKVHKESVSILQIVNEVVAAAESDANLKNQALKIEVEPGLEIEVDQFLLLSALSNFVQNATKYTGSGGTIRIRGHSDGKLAIIEVEDECGGLSSVAPSDLFKPFEQHSKNRDGLGLGLSIAYRAIALNDGTIEVKNLPGRGCIFKIALPIADKGVLVRSGTGREHC